MESASRGRGRPRLYNFPLTCRCGYSANAAFCYRRHAESCDQARPIETFQNTVETTESWLRRELDQKNRIIQDKDRQLQNQLLEKDRQLRRMSRQMELMSKRPRVVTNVTTTNNTNTNMVNVDMRAFTKERFDHIPREKIENLLRDPPTAVTELMRLVYQDPRNVNMRCPNKRENRYEVLKSVDGVLRWVAMTKDDALEDAHLTFATALEGYADEDDKGVGGRFCRWIDKLKDSQDGLDGGKMYAEQKARMHMWVTTRD